MKIKNIILIALLAFSFSFTSNAQEGIEFENGSWAEIMQKGKDENKLVFVDFYTQWCGPCFAMAEEVFVLPTVYSFYNSNFVNAKIDAEDGEGIDLAKKYGVKSYPTFVFIDANTGDVVHRSSSRQEAETFIYTGKSALIPNLRSAYLIDGFEENKGNISFLYDYLKYNGSIHNKKAVETVVEQLNVLGATLDDAKTWELFNDNITGFNNYLFESLIADYGKYTNMYGKDVVDAKLMKETSYASVELLESMPNFEGKKTNLTINKMNLMIREKKYDEAIGIIESALVDESIDSDKFLHSLKFAIRIRGTEQYPEVWLKKCGEYLQYIAYNNADRQDAYMHFEYAQYLESLLRQIPEASKVAPESILNKPTRGKEEYSMRSDRLKQKPKR